MSNCHESCVSRFLLLRGLVGCKDSLQALVLKCLQGPWKPRKPGMSPDSKWSPVCTEEFSHYDDNYYYYYYYYYYYFILFLYSLCRANICLISNTQQYYYYIIIILIIVEI
jgi:hypothetical protein